MRRLHLGGIGLLIVLLASIGQNALAIENDNTLTSEEYKALGIPDEIRTFAELDFVNMVFQDLSQKRKNLLPRNDSLRSGNVFYSVFSEKTIDNIIKTTPNDKIAMHSHLLIQLTLSLLQSAYFTQGNLHDYQFELIYIRLMDFYNKVKALELMERNIESDPVEPERLDMIYEELKSSLSACYFEIMLKTHKSLSKKDAGELTIRFQTYLSRMNKIEFLAQDLRIKELIRKYDKVSYPYY